MKKYIVIVFLVLCVVGLSAIFLWPILTTHSITINADHIKSITVEDGKKNKSAEYTDFSEIRLPNNRSVTLHYEVNDSDYSNGQTTIEPSESDVTIRPEYSPEKRLQVARGLQQPIYKQLKKLYPRIDAYSISVGDVLNRGLWFTTSLKYRGEYGLYTDTLRIVAKNEDDSWEIKTTPDILLTTTNYPDIPTGVLQWANQYES